MTRLTAKGRATRGRILDGAIEVIAERGVSLMTLDDVLTHTATSKSQLFHYFPGGRRDLLLAIAQQEADKVLADQQPHLSELDTWSSWQRWRDALVARYRSQGTTCPIGTLLTEVGRREVEAQEVTRVLLARWREDLATGVRALQANGEAPAHLDADAFAGALIVTIQGGVAILLATGRIDDLETALDLLLSQISPLGPSRQATRVASEAPTSGRPAMARG